MDQIVLTCSCGNELSVQPDDRQNTVDSSVPCRCDSHYFLSVTRMEPNSGMGR